ncbi:MAG TPA: YggS family pyridoxal phosphate-dependent enzyme [Dehalococcoidia bacterium]
MDIEANTREVRSRIERACERSRRSPEEITLVAVTKGFEAPVIRTAFDLGIRNFGENRVQEAEGKIAGLSELRSAITWHMVGHLQSNKAKSAVDLFDIIHSVDSVRLAGILNRLAKKQLPILLEVNVSGESTKAGFSPDQVVSAVKDIKQLNNLNLVGLMTVAPMAVEPQQVRPVFRKLRELRDLLGLKHLSMGMTDDFEVAVEEGATMLRIGRAIFGERRQQ